MTNTQNLYSFLDDYSEGCHPAILQALTETNMQQQTAYGEDDYSQEAKACIHRHMDGLKPEIYFIASGTLTNLIVIASCLRPHEAVIAPASGHITLRETGAIEATGHKIIAMPGENGKLRPEDVATALTQNAHFPHMAKPRMVYISNASELGTLYTKAELQALSALCREKGLLLFVDGARLGAALSADKSDLSLRDVADLSDIFWIGGTKAGALLGEAVVIANPALAEDFAFHIKQRGALLAKGRVLSLQFTELFRDNLYFDLTRHANQMADKFSTGVTAAGYQLLAETETNQIFPILPNDLISRLQEQFRFYVWGEAEADHSVIRLVTSWATDESQVDAFLAMLKH